jgi:DNA-binding transcriptional MerR regulator
VGTRLRTGELAAAAGVNVQTLRYYERRDLLPPPHRSAAGHRRYPLRAVGLLNMIKSAQQLGFSLNEITDIIAGTRLLSELAAHKIADIDETIRQLTRSREQLRCHTTRA